MAMPAPGQEHKNYRGKTAGLDKLTVERGSSVIAIDFHHKEKAYRTFHLPVGSTWTPGAHWHEQCDEFFKVVQGKVRFVQDGKARVVTAKDGELRIPKGVIHDFMRADVGGAVDEEEAIVEERVEPEDGSKEVFLRNVWSIVQEKEEIVTPFMKFLNIVMMCNRYDNFQVYLPGPWAKQVTYLIYYLCNFLAWIFNLRPWYPDYLPSRCWDAAGGKYRRPIKGE